MVVFVGGLVGKGLIFRVMTGLVVVFVDLMFVVLLVRINFLLGIRLV